MNFLELLTVVSVIGCPVIGCNVGVSAGGPYGGVLGVMVGLLLCRIPIHVYVWLREPPT